MYYVCMSVCVKAHAATCTCSSTVSRAMCIGVHVYGMACVGDCMHLGCGISQVQPRPRRHLNTRSANTRLWHRYSKCPVTFLMFYPFTTVAVGILRLAACVMHGGVSRSMTHAVPLCYHCFHFLLPQMRAPQLSGGEDDDDAEFAAAAKDDAQCCSKSCNADC